MDTVIELVDGAGNILAQSNDSLDESGGTAIYESDPLIDANVLQRVPAAFQPSNEDFNSLNPRDAGFRVVLPGTVGSPGIFHVRIRSSNIDDLDGAADPADLQDPAKLFDGLTKGNYEFQVRLTEIDEFPGVTVRHADIRYATNGIEVIGLPAHTPYTGEITENEDNSTVGGGDHMGNLLGSDRAALSAAGDLQSTGDLDFYQFDVNYVGVQSIGGVSATNLYTSAIFDVDFADNIGRPDTSVYVFDSVGRLDSDLL